MWSTIVKRTAQSLRGGLQGRTEHAFGVDFAAIRIHHGNVRAGALGAHAFAKGDHIRLRLADHLASFARHKRRARIMQNRTRIRN